ncbi:MAG: hemolysin family protein, partial [Oscillospiraceae bacterium]
ISGVFELDDVCAVDIMTHRTDVIAVDENTPASEVVKLANAEGISRLPVFNGRLDNVTGIIYIKDLLTIFCDPETAENPIRDFMRNAMFVPESCHARELLVEFKTKHTQIAVVVDEYGGTSGIVTMEDVLEEIVGNIQDEFDNEEEPLVAFEGGYICDASIDLEDIFKAFNLEPPTCGEDEDFDTVSGLITQTLGKIPTDNEQATVHYGGISFLVCEADPKRILKVKCTLDEVSQ